MKHFWFSFKMGWNWTAKFDCISNAGHRDSLCNSRVILKLILKLSILECGF